MPLLSLVNLLNPFFNCILDLGSAHNLPADCVLGCGYFTCLSVNLCEFFSIFLFLYCFIQPYLCFHSWFATSCSSNDAIFFMIIDIIFFFFLDDCSLLYKWNGCFLDLQTLLKRHCTFFTMWFFWYSATTYFLFRQPLCTILLFLNRHHAFFTTTIMGIIWLNCWFWYDFSALFLCFFWNMIYIIVMKYTYKFS